MHPTQASANLWELPDALLEGTGMNSRNHHMWSSYSAYLVKSVAGIAHATDLAGKRVLELRPGFSALHASDATLQLASGVVRLQWVRHGGRQIDRVSEGDVARFQCGERGGRIVAVETASFGTPRAGNNGDLSIEVRDECHAALSAAVMTRECVGREACELRATREVFEMSEQEEAQCEKSASRSAAGPWSEPRRLWAAVRCETPQQALQADVTLPVGTAARLRLPLRTSAHGPQRLLEAGQLVWAEEDAVDTPKIAGIQMVERQGDELSVELLGGGEWSFMLESAR